jgi:probable HAF family extracellular repeat protein
LKTTLHTVCLSLLLSTCAVFAGQQQPLYQVSLFYKQQASVKYIGGDAIEGTGYYLALGMNNRNEVIGSSESGDYSQRNLQILPVSIVKGVAHVFNDTPFNGPEVLAGFSSINDLGEIVGWQINIAGQHEYCFIIRPSGPAAGFRMLPAQFSGVVVNNLGTIAGQQGNAALPGDPGPGFIYKNGLVTSINGPVVAINNRDQVVGFYYTTPVQRVTHTFLYSHGQYTDLGVPASATSVYPNHINDSAEIVGQITYPFTENFNGVLVQTTVDHPFLYKNGKLEDLGLPPGETSADVVGFNNSGTIVGSTGSGTNPWIYTNGKYQFLKDVIPAGYVIYDVVAINDQGQILVDAQKASPTFSKDMFLLTPTFQKHH